MHRRIEVVFFQRKPLPIHKSVEFIFDDVRKRMPPYIHCVKKVFKKFSKGILPRLSIVLEAARSQGDVNHLTGDVQFAAIGLTKSRTIMTILDCGMLSGSKGFKHKLLKYFWFTLPLKKCSFVTVISESTKKELAKYVNYPDNDIYVIPVAISNVYRHTYKPFNESCPVILQVGTTPNKNIHRLIEAIKGIRCHIDIIGELQEDVVDLMAKHEISYSSYQNLSDADLFTRYQKCDIVCFVSTYEGFGMPIVEAQAVGRPVVTSNISSMPEVSGGAACLVNPFDVNAIKGGILKIITDKSYRETLIEQGQTNCKRFDPEVIANRYLELYEKVVERRI